MAFTEFEHARIELVLGEYIAKRRPPPDIRHEVDLAYRIEGQSVILFEIRSGWDDPTRKIELPIAKSTYVKNSKTWKIYWQRADLKWHAYDPCPTAKSIEDFIKVVDDDDYACFWG